MPEVRQHNNSNPQKKLIEAFASIIEALAFKILASLSMQPLSMWSYAWEVYDRRSDYKNYRGISLLSAAYKILSSIMSERLKPHVIRILGPYHYGFMTGKSTTDQLFTLRQILGKTYEYNIDTHHLFIDFRQTYDIPTRDKLFRAMNTLKLIKLSQMTLGNTLS